MAASIEYRLTGGASNSDPDASLGGVSSSNTLSATAMNNLFDDVSASEASAGDTEYRAIDVHNAGDATATSVAIYMSTETSSSDSQIDLGINDTPASAINSTASIADESTAPSSVTFAHYTSASKLSLPDIAAGSYCRVWVRWVVDAGAGNDSNDQGTIAVDYA